MSRTKLIKAPRDVKRRNSLIAYTLMLGVWVINKNWNWKSSFMSIHQTSLALLKSWGKICMIGILKSLIIIYLGRIKWANAEGEWHSTSNVFLWESGALALLVKLFKHFSMFFIWRHGKRWMAGICNVGSFGTSVVERCLMFVILERLCLQKSDSYWTEEHSG